MPQLALAMPRNKLCISCCAFALPSWLDMNVLQAENKGRWVLEFAAVRSAEKGGPAGAAPPENNTHVRVVQRLQCDQHQLVCSVAEDKEQQRHLGPQLVSQARGGGGPVPLSCRV